MLQSWLRVEWFQTGGSVVFASSETDKAIMSHQGNMLTLVQVNSEVVGCLNEFFIYNGMFFFGFYLCIKVSATQAAFLLCSI